MAKNVTAGQLSDELLAMARAAPEVTLEAVRDLGLELQSRLVQEEIDATHPHKPVDQSQYRGSWRGTKTKDGYLVYNLAKHALWIERGRRPGGKPGAIFRFLLPWAKRKRLAPGIAWAVAVKIAMRGYKPRWVLKRATKRAVDLLPHRLRAALDPVLKKG